MKKKIQGKQNQQETAREGVAFTVGSEWFVFMHKEGGTTGKGVATEVENENIFLCCIEKNMMGSWRWKTVWRFQHPLFVVTLPAPFFLCDVAYNLFCCDVSSTLSWCDVSSTLLYCCDFTSTLYRCDVSSTLYFDMIFPAPSFLLWRFSTLFCWEKIYSDLMYCS